jgi:hypothetical protein
MFKTSYSIFGFWKLIVYKDKEKQWYQILSLSILPVSKTGVIYLISYPIEMANQMQPVTA